MSRFRNTIRQIPNALSISRIGLAFAFPFLPTSWHLPVILWALFSEFLDGFLARRLDAVTPLGQALDPIADKLFVLSTALVLISTGLLTPLQFILIAMRDIIVGLGSISVAFESKSATLRNLKPRVSGKIATAFQFALLVALFARLPMSALLLQITIVVSVLSAIDYLYAVLHRRFDAEIEES